MMAWVVLMTNRPISHYKIYMKSQTWSLWMIFLAVDLAIVNSCFEYRETALYILPKKRRLDLLHVRLELANNLIKISKRPPRKRLFLALSNAENVPQKRGCEVSLLDVRKTALKLENSIIFV